MGSGKRPGKKILLVANSDWYLFNFRLSLARHLRASGYETILASPSGPYVERLRALGFRWVEVPLKRRALFPPGEILLLARLVRLYRAERPDIVHHSTIKPVIYGTLAGRIAGVSRIVDSITGLGYVFTARGPKGAVLRAVVGRLYRFALADARVRVIFENPADRGLFVSGGMVRESATVVIGGVGVDLATFRPEAPPARRPAVVVMPSRVLWDKGVGEFVQAARILRDQGRDARFVLVGSPDPENPSSVPERQIREWVAEGCIEWWGYREDMPRVLAGSHIVALPSYGEGLPRVLLEAAACGRPVVTTDAPGCRCAVQVNRTGLLVPVRDAGALARALATLLDDPRLRSRMGRRGVQYAAENFDHRMTNALTMAQYADETPVRVAGDPSPGRIDETVCAE